MSSALVKRSLELFDDDLKTETVKKKKKHKDPMAMISTNKIGVKKGLKKLKNKQGKKKSNVQKQSAIELYKKSKPVDHTERSIQALQIMARVSTTDQNVAKTIIDHHQARKTRRRPEPSSDSGKPKQSMFTDNDFEQFAKDYDLHKK